MKHAWMQKKQMKMTENDDMFTVLHSVAFGMDTPHYELFPRCLGYSCMLLSYYHRFVENMRCPRWTSAEPQLDDCTSAD